jgi:hypothetical protein
MKSILIDQTPTRAFGIDSKLEVFMNIKATLTTMLVLLSACSTVFSQTNVTKEDYLKTIKEVEGQIWENYTKSVDEWQKSDPTTRSKEPPKPHNHWARFSGLLYSVTGDKKYAEHAREILLTMPSSDNFYAIQIIKQIEGSGLLTEEDLQVINEKIVAGAERAVLYWPEWGAMNHATNGVVNNLTAAMQYMPDHPDYDRWKQKRDINLSGSWGLWSIEDSQIYIPVWNKPMMQYAELEGREDEFYAMPMTKYYFDYLVQLLTPGGQIVEFGDGRYGKGYTWDWMISVLEKGASVYRDGKMKWAAHRIFEAHAKELGHRPGAEIVEAYVWADDSIKEEIPTDKSRLVLEDYVGKKVVFRSGWDRNATYLFLNFMDDAPFGIDGKEHMITSINVETEKNHHGHADENAIGLLTKDGSILLYESGYRETSSTGPDGQFRADVFHNKLIVREGLADPNWRLMPFLLDGGRYKFVNTKLMHFRRFKEVDISRTRLTYDEMGYQWDRLITYVKGKEWFVIFDIVKILKDGDKTLANLFYTQNITDFDVNNRIWFDTYYRTIAASPTLAPFYAGERNKEVTRLLMYFPEGTSFRVGAEQLRNNVQTEWAVYSAKSDSFKSGDILVYTTLLIPHPKSVDAKTIVASLAGIEVFHKGNGYGLKLPTESGYMQFNAMLDLEAEYLKENVRPRYNFESGRADYGELTTDARYCYLNKNDSELFYSFFQASKLVVNGQIIFEAQGMEFGQDDGSYSRYGVPKWVAWEDKIRLKKK